MGLGFNHCSNSCVCHCREKHHDLKSNMDRLQKLTISGPEGKEFLEPKVSNLWNMATKGDFTREELESLHVSICLVIV